MSLTAEQHAQRRGKITASIMPEIAGVNPYRGPLAAWLRITGRHHEEEQAADDPRGWGHRVERELLAWYRDTQHRELAHWGTLEHPAHPWLLATPDACVFGERGLVECKNVGSRVAHHWDAGPPQYVVVQSITQIEVCDADWCDVVASIGGTPPQVWRIERDRGLGADVIEVGRIFYFNHIVTDDPPPPDEQTTAKEIEGVFPEHSDIVVAAPDDVELLTLCQTYRDAKGRESAAQKDAEAAKVLLCARIGDRKGVEIPRPDGKWLRATWTHRDPIEVKAFTRPGYRHFDLREVDSMATKLRKKAARIRAA